MPKYVATAGQANNAPGPGEETRAGALASSPWLRVAQLTDVSMSAAPRGRARTVMRQRDNRCAGSTARSGLPESGLCSAASDTFLGLAHLFKSQTLQFLL